MIRRTVYDLFKVKNASISSGTSLVKRFTTAADLLAGVAFPSTDATMIRAMKRGDKCFDVPVGEQTYEVHCCDEGLPENVPPELRTFAFLTYDVMFKHADALEQLIREWPMNPGTFSFVHNTKMACVKLNALGAEGRNVEFDFEPTGLKPMRFDSWCWYALSLINIGAGAAAIRAAALDLRHNINFHENSPDAR